MGSPRTAGGRLGGRDARRPAMYGYRAVSGNGGGDFSVSLVRRRPYPRRTPPVRCGACRASAARSADFRRTLRRSAGAFFRTGAQGSRPLRRGTAHDRQRRPHRRGCNRPCHGRRPDYAPRRALPCDRLRAHRQAACPPSAGAGRGGHGQRPADEGLVEALGLTSERTGRYLHGLSQYDFIFNTVPSPILDRAQLGQLSADCTLIDLSSPPYGIAPELCRALGRKCIYASGLPGKCAPKTAGILYARQIITESEESE